MFLPNDFKDLSPWLLGSIALNLWQQKTSWQMYETVDVCSPHGIQETKEEEKGQ